MLLVLIAWLYVAVLMAVAEATHPQGTLLGAFFTLLLYGIVPITIVMYLLGAPARLRARKRSQAGSPVDEPDAGGEPPGAAVPAKREEP